MLVTVLLLTGAVVEGAGQDPSLEEIRARIEQLRVRSVQTAGGGMVVSGPDPLGNVQLLSALEDAAEAIEKLTGLALPLGRQRVGLLVLEPDAAAVEISVQHRWFGGAWIHRVVLSAYRDLEKREGRAAMCKALLSVYAGAAGAEPPVLPAWLWQGTAEVLNTTERHLLLEQAYDHWREGRLAGPRRQLATTAAASETSLSSTACGALVLWFADPPGRAARFEALFRHLAAGGGADSRWMESDEHAFAGMDIDEHWDRWMLGQRHAVRLLGAVSARHLEAIRSEWLIFRSRDGIPASVTLPAGARVTVLAAHRQASWFGRVLREKRRRLERLALGRPPRYQTMVAAYVAVLDALEQAAPAERVSLLEVEAETLYRALRRDVEADNGLWVEP